MSYARSSSSATSDPPDSERARAARLVGRLFDRQRRRYEKRIHDLEDEIRRAYGDRAELTSRLQTEQAKRTS